MMPQRKIELIENARARAAAYARRAKGALEEGVGARDALRVLVCAPAGAGTRLVWKF
jgi:hypothetical protein